MAGYDDVETAKELGSLSSRYDPNVFSFQRIITTTGARRMHGQGWRRQYRHSQIRAENRWRRDSRVTDDSGKTTIPLADSIVVEVDAGKTMIVIDS